MEPQGQVVGNAGGEPASLSIRFAASLVDLVICPIFIGIIAGFALLAVPEQIRNIILIAINIVWLIFRDAVFSPGRNFLWRRIINIIYLILSIVLSMFILFANNQSAISKTSASIYALLSISVGICVFIFGWKKMNLKLISLRGEKIGFHQAVIRNLFLIVPFILITGYICEIGKIFISNNIFRKFFYVLGLLVVILLMYSFPMRGTKFIITSACLSIVTIIFLVFDRYGSRLGDDWAKTKVVNA